MAINPRNELFCRYYATDEVGTFGNATRAYLKVYPKSSEEAAAVSAYDLLRKPKITGRLKELWKLSKLSDEEVDSHLASIVRQDKDLKAKLGGIKEHNAVGGRIIQKHDLSLGRKSTDKLQEEELNRLMDVFGDKG